jgi:tRNA-splicing ligase RtcB
MTIRTWLPGPMPKDVAAAVERVARAEDVRHIAIMPDVHLANDVCIGAVVATSRLLYPAAVGGDIGCGMAAIRLDREAAAIRDEAVAARILGGLYRAIPARRHTRGAAKERLPEELDERPLSDPRLERLKRSDGQLELATLGSGNHFVELQADDEGALWVMLHSGSRAMGQAIRDHHAARASPRGGGLAALDADSDDGRAYLADMEWALLYADVSRRRMIDAVLGVLGAALGAAADAGSYRSCHHNHVRRETHGGEALWVHRKGAIFAGEGAPGVIPGSMGSPSFHVEGRGADEALTSSSHGAGRVMSRAEARRRITARTLRKELSGVFFDHRLERELVDEAPSAYKDIGEVMRAQRELTRIVRRLRPVLCFKGT